LLAKIHFRGHCNEPGCPARRAFDKRYNGCRLRTSSRDFTIQLSLQAEGRGRNSSLCWWWRKRHEVFRLREGIREAKPFTPLKMTRVKRALKRGAGLALAWTAEAAAPYGDWCTQTSPPAGESRRLRRDQGARSCQGVKSSQFLSSDGGDGRYIVSKAVPITYCRLI